MKSEDSIPENKNASGVKEIARRANVSIATVDRVIHNRTGVSQKTKEKILKIIKELDYQPNILASRLASGKRNKFAIVIPETSVESSFWAAPVQGITRAQNEIKQYGVDINFLLFNLLDKKSFVSIIDQVIASDYDGIVLAPSFVDESLRLVNVCNQKQIPYVLIDSDLPNSKKLSYIGPPYQQSGYLGAKLLTYRLKGKSNVLFLNIALEADSYNYAQIEEGFRKYFETNSIENTIYRLDIHQSDFESVFHYLDRQFINQPDIEAIFVSNSQVSTVAKYLIAKEKTHISLIGYDFTPDNIHYLEENIIDFLICHQPEYQGYLSVKNLYQSVVLGQAIQKENLMPIDIITKENHMFYRN